MDGGSHPIVLIPQQLKDLSASGILVSVGRRSLGRSSVETNGGQGSLCIAEHALATTLYFHMTTSQSHSKFPSDVIFSAGYGLALHIVPGTLQKMMYGSSAFWFSTSESKFDAITSPCHCDPFYHKSQFLSSISQKPVHTAGNKTLAFDTTANSENSLFQTLRVCLP